MIRINLLPHREARRKQAKSAFVAMLVLAGVIGLGAILIVGMVLAAQIDIQNQRNQAIKDANAELDVKIAEISKLKQEIEALKARQQAVEDLQSDRNQPVLLLDELVKQTPEGVYLVKFNQDQADSQRIVLRGFAQSNERVSEMLRNLGNNSAWLERPDLQEIRLTTLAGSTPKNPKKVYDFSMTVGIKRPRDKEKAAQEAKEGKKKGIASASAPASDSAPANAPTAASAGKPQ